MKQIRKIVAVLLVALLCLSAVGALADGKVKTTGEVNMRRGAGLDYAAIRSIGEGKTLSYDKTSKDERGVKWYRVSYKGKTGWVSSKYAKPVEEGSSSGSGKKVKTTGSVNLRKGAGLDYAAIRTVPEGKVLSYDKTKKDERGVKWYRVSYKGKTGWISSMYAKKQ